MSRIGALRKESSGNCGRNEGGGGANSNGKLRRLDDGSRL